ncbi:MAG: TIR domain-containing protein [Saprospiraceae bacterium]|nr:TIR domain-containing protein [Saprospiraceae bacterium]
MWRLIAAAGIGIVTLILKNWEADEDDSNGETRKRVFISFAIEDKDYREHLVSQAKSNRSPFEFIDMSVKKPWPKEEWKKRCRSKIKSCDGVIVLLSKNTWHSGGVRWEIKCANEEGLPVVGMHIKKNDQGAILPELNGKQIITWSWENLSNVINNF